MSLRTSVMFLWPSWRNELWDETKSFSCFHVEPWAGCPVLSCPDSPQSDALTSSYSCGLLHPCCAVTVSVCCWVLSGTRANTLTPLLNHLSLSPLLEYASEKKRS